MSKPHVTIILIGKKNKLPNTIDEDSKVNRDVIINRDKFKVTESVVDKEVNFKRRDEK